MDGYILTTTKNTFGWVEYDNDISLDYKEFLKGERLLYKDLPLFYRKFNIELQSQVLV